MLDLLVLVQPALIAKNHHGPLNNIPKSELRPSPRRRLKQCSGHRLRRQVRQSCCFPVLGRAQGGPVPRSLKCNVMSHDDDDDDADDDDGDDGGGGGGGGGADDEVRWW